MLGVSGIILLSNQSQNIKAYYLKRRGSDIPYSNPMLFFWFPPIFVVQSVPAGFHLCHGEVLLEQLHIRLNLCLVRASALRRIGCSRCRLLAGCLVLRSSWLWMLRALEAVDIGSIVGGLQRQLRHGLYWRHPNQAETEQSGRACGVELLVDVLLVVDRRRDQLTRAKLK